MYPIFALGLTAAGAATRFALRGEHQLLAFIYPITAALLLSGSFGFTLGMMKALYASQSTNDLAWMTRIILTGAGEAANMPAAALMFAVITAVCVAVGQRRFPLPNPSAIAR
jgi:hypothetical protein